LRCQLEDLLFSGGCMMFQPGQSLNSDSKTIAELEALKKEYALLEMSYYRKVEEYEDKLQNCRDLIKSRDGAIERLEEQTRELKEKLNKSTPDIIKDLKGFRCKKSGSLGKSEKTFTIRKFNHFHSEENDT
jgi:polyhydroxyalkanoate synthesis regulator phasin